MTHQERVLALSLLTLTFAAACSAEHAEDGELALRGQLASRSRHKVVVDAKDHATRKRLARSTVAEYDYGSFVMLIVEGEVPRLDSAHATVRDDFDLVRLKGRTIDARDPLAVYNSIEPGLKNGRLLRGSTPSEGMYIIQLVGPVKDEWLEQLQKEGLQLITYIPENAYVVYAGDAAAARLPQLSERFRFVQLAADYEPAFKIAPALRGVGGGSKINVVVQVVPTEREKYTLAALRDMALEFRGVWSVPPYINVEMMIESSMITELARFEDIFDVEPKTERRRLDEVQGQILANNISAGLPTAPGYLAWHDARGFTTSQFGSFVVEIVDDSHQLTGTAGHPDLPASRVVFQNNPTNAGATQDGHGFLNSHLIGGFNNSTGTAFEDANLYNYGMGIAPYSRVGVTDIFGPGFATPTAWENTAYGSGARISSNSWGFIALYDYDANAQEYDTIVRDAQAGTAGLQELIVVFAAGNDGPGANTVSSPSTAKNVICVGAGENVRQTGTDGCAVSNTGANNANDIISFSSRGPVNSAAGDGRIKPDIMAPGTHIQAGVPQAAYTGFSVCNQYWPTGQTLYGWSSGTSHSCPAVAGGAALLYQHFLNQSMPAPSPAMVKAYLMNSTERMTGTGANDTLPSNNQGMGRMNLARALDTTPRILVDQTQIIGTTGGTHQITGAVATSAEPFRVSLAWSDAAGPTTGAPWVNDLNLVVEINGNTYLGNVFSGGTSIVGGTAATRDNSESVFLPAGTTGAFTVTVVAANIAGNGVPGNADATDQDFALVIYNGTTSTSPLIGVSPSSLSWTVVSGSANPTSQALSITNGGGGTINFTAATDQTWISASPSSGTAPATVNVSVDIQGLAVGTHNGNVIISDPGASNSPQTIPVTVIVQGGPSLVLSPTSISFSATEGGFNPSAQNLQITNGGGGTFNWTASDDAPWLSVAPTSGAAGQSALVSASISGLTAGTYNGSVTITADSGAANSPQVVPVTLTVNTPPPPTISTTPASMSFSGVAGGSNPSNQTLEIQNTASSAPMSWSATTDQAWLSISASSGTSPSFPFVSVNINNLAAGSYSGNVIITVTGATNSPYNVPVSLTVAPPGVQLLGNPGFETTQNPWGRGGSAAFYTSNGSSPHGGTGYVYFGDVNNGSGLVAQQVSTSGFASLTLSLWLRITTSETAGTVNDRVHIELRNTSGVLLANLATYSNLDAATFATYQQRTFDVSAYAGQTVRVQFQCYTNASIATTFYVDDVTLTGGGGPAIGYSPTSLSFSGTAGGSNPPSQSVTITNIGSGTLNWTATDDAGWLSVSPGSGTAPSTMSVSASLSGLAAGTYNGTITLTAAGATNSPQTIPVTLTVDAGAPVLVVAPSSLSFSADQGGANPASQTLSISEGSGGSLGWSASGDQTWLSVSPASGTAPGSPAVSVDISGLSAGVHNGNVIVTAPGASNSPVSVPVTVTISANPPVFALSPTSMSFTALQGGSNPASQSLTINNSGGGSLDWSASSNASWLSIAPASGTAPSSASVSVNISGLSPGTYNGTLSFTAPGAAGASVPVTLTVTSASTELIANGGFEGGTTTPWVRGGTGQTYSASGGTPHSGSGHMILGDVNSANAQVTQVISVPSGATNVTLSYWLQITTSETLGWNADRVDVLIQNSSGALLQTLATHGNTNAAAFANYTQQSFNVTAYAGQTIRVQFRVTTNGSLTTRFNLDDVSMLSQ